MRTNQPPPYAVKPDKRRGIRRRPNSLPPFWRNITGPYGIQSYMQRRDWKLVLSARGIPHILVLFRKREYIYVPPLLEQVARLEVIGFDNEAYSPTRYEPLPAYSGSMAAALFLLPLLLWHALRSNLVPSPDFLPAPQLWLDAGILDSVLLRVRHQWYRLITALTLHADILHLTGNMVFGALFLSLAARLVGVGRAVWLALLGGIAGNALIVLLRPRAVLSLGFSTSVFAAVGITAGFVACARRDKRKAFLAVAAGAALLAMLGTEGENADYAAHIAGLGCGLALGALEVLRQRHGFWALPQWAAGIAALALPLAAWLWAFSGL